MRNYLGLRGRALINVVTCLSAATFFLFGYDNGVMSGIITAPQFFAVMGNLSATMQGTVTSIYEVGATVGAIAAMFIGNNLGRRKMLLLGGIVMIIGAVIQAASYGVAQIIVARIVSGLGIGFLTATSPVYVSECTRPEDRGLALSVTLTNLIFGIVVSYWIDYGFTYLNGSISWRFPLAFQIVPCIIVCVLAVFLPESPRWLLHHKRNEEAMRSLSVLRGLPEDDDTVLNEKDEILAAIALEEESTEAVNGWKGLFLDGGVKGNKRLLLSIGINIFQELSGTNTLTYYSTVIYEQSVGLSRHMSLLMGGFLQLWFLAASFVTWYTIDKVGRRTLFMFGFCGMGVCFLVLMGMLGYPGNKAAGIVATIATFLFQGFFTWGTMATVWLYPSEVLPLSLRTKGAGLAAASNWIFGFMIVEVTPDGIEKLGRYFYIIWALFNFVIVAIIYFTFPETSNISLESVDLLFSDDINGEKYEGWRPAVKKSIRMYKDSRRGDANGETASQVQHSIKDKQEKNSH